MRRSVLLVLGALGPEVWALSLLLVGCAPAVQAPPPAAEAPSVEAASAPTPVPAEPPSPAEVPSPTEAPGPAAEPSDGTSARDCVVGIDVGHSADRPGATSARGRPEHAFNVDLASDLLAALRGVEHIDRALLLDAGDLNLTERAPAVADLGATLLLSVHHDSVQPQYLTPWEHDGVARMHSDAFRGHSLFVSALGAQPAASERLGRALGQALRSAGRVPTKHHAEAIEGEGRPWVDEDLGLHRFDGLAVLRTSPIPAVLLEAGVIVHRDEEALLASPAGRSALVAAVVQGLQAFCAPGVSGSGAGSAP